MARFGYLNQSNPLTIADHEAQEMINCSIERGWIEYKDYPVPSANPIPNREAKLPNGKVVKVLPTISNPDNVLANKGKPLYQYNNENWKIIVDNVASSLYNPIVSDRETVIYATESDFSSKVGKICEYVTGVVVNQSGVYQYTFNLKYGNQQNSKRFYYSEESLKFLKFVEIDFAHNGTPSHHYFKEGVILTPDGSGNVKVTLPPDFDPSLTGGGLTIKFLALCSSTNDDVFLIEDNDPYQGDSSSGNPNSVKVFYAVTTVETDTFSPLYGYESSPVFFTATAVPFFQKIKLKINYINSVSTRKLNIYRIPFGGDEYLSHSQVTIGTGTSYIEIVDEKPDKLLGQNSTATFPSILETEGNTSPFYGADKTNSVILHQNSLFVAYDKFVYYSKPNSFAEFPAENFFAFPDEVIGFCQYYSELAIFTEKEIYLLYGENANGFILTKVNSHFSNNILNSAQFVYGKMLSLISDFESVFKYSNRTGLLLTNSRFSYDICLRIKDLLSWTKSPSASTAFNDYVNKNTVLENRYYVAELIRNETQNNVAVRLKKNLVYDVLSDGFCVYDESINDSVNHKNYFKYRTKEFQIKGMFTQGAQYHKSMWVRGKGNFKIKFYGDNVALSNDESGYVYDNTKNVRTGEANTDVDNVKTYYFNVRPDRYVTFSIEFIGEEGAEIHDWGIL